MTFDRDEGSGVDFINRILWARKRRRLVTADFSTAAIFCAMLLYETPASRERVASSSSLVHLALRTTRPLVSLGDRELDGGQIATTSLSTLLCLSTHVASLCFVVGQKQPVDFAGIGKRAQMN
jgi:hypothetical protein